jgi:hypothetical protein
MSITRRSPYGVCPKCLMSPSSAWIVKIGVCDIIIRIPAARARYLTLPGMTPK